MVTSRLAPRLLLQLEAELLRIEWKWRFEHSDESLKPEREGMIAGLKRDLARYLDCVSGPAAPSLAAVVASGHVADPKAADAVSALLAGLKSIAPSAKPGDRQAAVQKLLAEFDKQTKETASVDIALAIVDAAVDRGGPCVFHPQGR